MTILDISAELHKIRDLPYEDQKVRIDELMKIDKQRNRSAVDKTIHMKVDNPQSQEHYAALIAQERAIFDANGPPGALPDWNPKLERPCVSDFPVKDTLQVLDENNRVLATKDYNNAFTFDEAEQNGDPIPSTTLDKMQHRKYLTFHKNGFAGFYKPSIAEILSQLPAEAYNVYVEDKLLYLKNDVVSNEIRECTCPASDKDYHIATTDVYFE